MRHSLTFLMLALATVAVAQTPKEAPGYNPRNDNFETEVWQELRDVEPPAFPADETLVEIYVSPVATNKYYIDTASITTGKDGVVRYVMVVRTSGGATNVSFEGIHCSERKWKHYASGRNDKTWSKTQMARQEWRQIENKPLNPVHAIVSRTLFCPMGMAIRNADEGRNALRLGKHPLVN
ncbi:MAG: CNP1-like family protein [Rhodocyclales bacterium]|nr:CNP1-like family protein [Rhodocyclales bacterium]